MPTVGTKLGPVSSLSAADESWPETSHCRLQRSHLDSGSNTETKFPILSSDADGDQQFVVLS